MIGHLGQYISFKAIETTIFGWIIGIDFESNRFLIKMTGTGVKGLGWNWGMTKDTQPKAWLVVDSFVERHADFRYRFISEAEILNTHNWQPLDERTELEVLSNSLRIKIALTHYNNK